MGCEEAVLKGQFWNTPEWNWKDEENMEIAFWHQKRIGNLLYLLEGCAVFVAVAAPFDPLAWGRERSPGMHKAKNQG